MSKPKSDRQKAAAKKAAAMKRAKRTKAVNKWRAKATPAQSVGKKRPAAPKYKIAVRRKKKS